MCYNGGCMLNACDISPGQPKTSRPGGTAFQPVVSGILPKTGAALALVFTTCGFRLAVARQFSDGRPQGPSAATFSLPVPPNSGFRGESRPIKVDQDPSRRSRATLDSWPAQRRHRIPGFLIPPTPAGVAEKLAKSARGFTVKFSPIKVNQGESRQSNWPAHQKMNRTSPWTAQTRLAQPDESLRQRKECWPSARNSCAFNPVFLGFQGYSRLFKVIKS